MGVGDELEAEVERRSEWSLEGLASKQEQGWDGVGNILEQWEGTGEEGHAAVGVACVEEVEPQG